MKKLALVLVFILLLGCAYAEPVKMNSVEDVNRILYANLFYKRLENGYALFDFNNNRLTEGIYAASFNYRAGMLKSYLAKGQGVNIRGVLHEDGTEAVPFKYGDVQILNENWVYGLTLVEAADRNNFDYEVTINDVSKVYLIDTVDVYSIQTGMVMNLTRENFSAINAYGKYINIMDRATGAVTTYDASFNAVGVADNGSIYNDDFVVFDLNTFYDNGRYGATDANGNVVIESDYARIYYPKEGKHATITLNDQEGLIDINGNVIIEPMFDEIEFLHNLPIDADSEYCYDGYVLFNQGGKLGYATAAGITCEAKYSAEILNNHGVSCSFTDMEGNFNIMAADGVISTVTGYKDVISASYSGGYYYIVSGENYTKGLIDWHGNVIFPCEYRDIEISGDGKYLLVSAESYGDVDIYTLDNAPAEIPAEAPAEVPAEAPAEAPAVKSGIGSVSVPKVDFSGMSAPAQEGKPGIGSVSVPKVDFSGIGQAAAQQQAPAAEAPAASANNAGAIAMLQSAKALLAADPAANAGAIATLIDSAIAMLQ